jgi:apolipoprotein D and lipocalin family protein
MFILATMCFSCSSHKDLPVVPALDVKKYQGTWYEIARLPNSFEKKLDNCSATYTLRSDGKIIVYNKGQYIEDPSKTSDIRGLAWVPDVAVPAKLKVRFFWPFAGKYWIIALDSNYRHALVGDPSRKYLWVLAREKKLDAATLQSLLDIAKMQGFDTAKIIMVKQE